MNAFLYPLKNYLYIKTKVKYIIPVLAIFIFTACTTTNKKGVVVGVSYDMPPTAPVPPEKFCFEQKTSNNATNRIELTVEGDSVTGNVDYAGSENIKKGDFKGVILGSTLIVSYKFKTDSGFVTQEQEWKIENESLFNVSIKQTPDTLSADKKALNQSWFSSPLHKVACK